VGEGNEGEELMGEFTTVCQAGDIPAGQGATFTVGERLVAVFYAEGKYFAIDDICPHMGASLGAGHLDEQLGVTCPWHAWRFCVADGTWCDNPNPRLKLETFEVRVENNQVQVRVAASGETS
jgi:nitrite reductase (NADH) small subunit/3-phenylpropionate/trans-cinnamate dioxygenase ferredoxin subunit